MDKPLNVNLNGENVVITGAGGVICGYFAELTAACGANVALLDINLEASEKIAEKINKTGGKATAYSCNVLKKEDVLNVAEKIEKDMGSCSILINGAGGNSPKATTDDEIFKAENLEEDIKTFFDLDEEGIQFVFDLNFIGTLLPTQAFAKQMANKSKGIIVNISSMNAYKPLTKIPAYSAAKAAISNFTQWLAVYFSQSGIRCNAIAPGFFITTQNKNLLFDEKGNAKPRAEKILSNTPMGRFGEVEELGGTLLYLLDEKASKFVNGVVIPVDGGFSAYSGV